MADVHAFMAMKLAEYRKKNPELAYRFIDAAPDVIKSRIELDGWRPVKEVGSGVAGEVKIGDLILAAKPRKEVEEEKKKLQAKTKQALASTTRKFYSDLGRYGGYGQYLKPLTPEQIERGSNDWTRR